MNFLNLEYFLAVSRSLNMTQAAADLKISQQALSKHILNLEKEMNLKLFERGKQLSLTEAGNCFVAYATRILTLKSQMESHMSDISERQDNNIRIGVTQARSPIYLPSLLSKFCNAFPETKIHLVENQSDMIFKDLQNDKLDLVIGVEPHDKLNFKSFPLCMEEYAIMASPKMLEKYFTPDDLLELEKNPERVTVETFKHCPFVCFERSLRIGRIFQDTCKEIGFKPNIVIESKNMNTLLYLCAFGLGVTLLPYVYLEIARKQSELLQTICAFPVTDVPLQTQIVLSIHRERFVSRLTREFIEIAKDEFKSSEGGLSTDIEFFNQKTERFS